MATLRVPGATYRLQLNRDFRFEDARAVVPYLSQLGITDVYCSPLLQSRRGSTHGYDITDPSRLNAELGTEEEFEALVAKLREFDMGLIADLVPNHMAASSENPWWMDVLENGRASSYAAYFDIDWRPPSRTLENKILLPILGKRYANVLESQEIRLFLEESGFFVQYFDTKLPLSIRSYRHVLGHHIDRLEQTLDSESPGLGELQGLLAATAAPEPLKERLWQLYTKNAEIKKVLDDNLRAFNGRRRDPGSFLLLDRLLAEQVYILSYWLAADQEINYRRFFAITDLVGVRIEDLKAFELCHAVHFRLAEKGMLTGFRIDHIDGLSDPTTYLRRLQSRVAPSSEGAERPGFYVIVEKILADGETLPNEWPIYGTTGYRFLNRVNQLFVSPDSAAALDRIYRRFVGERRSYESVLYRKKKQVIETLLPAEIRALGHQLSLLARQDRYARELPREHLDKALVEVTAHFPVYRTYTQSLQLSPTARRYIETAIRKARARNSSLAPCLTFLKNVLLLESGEHLAPEQKEARLGFVMRWQQLTGPVMAKGFEDSVLYAYNSLLSLNEVGGDPSSKGLSAGDFDRFMRKRHQAWPHTLNTTTTHDTKRAEDVRARINVLSTRPDVWRKKLEQWSRWNAARRRRLEGRYVPDRNEEIFLYQTLLGAWPSEAQEIPSFKERLKAYLVKATREAMIHTKWTLPNLKHEKALLDFAESILDARRTNRFLKDFLSLQREIAYCGAINGLAQTLIKIVAPGVPDFYQGSELWDLRLVDPDNRGPVDFRRRASLLEELKSREAAGLGPLTQELIASWWDGRIKLYVISKALEFRRQHRDLFQEGGYISLVTERASQICAFARRLKSSWALLVVPLFPARMAKAGRLQLRVEQTGGSLRLPRTAPTSWRNVFTGEKLEASSGKQGPGLRLSEIFNSFPVSLLYAGQTVRQGPPVRADKDSAEARGAS